MCEINWVCSKCGSKSTVVDASTQTSADPIDSLVAFQDVSCPHMSSPLPNLNSGRTFMFTDWIQMGRDLRQIADELHRTSTTNLHVDEEVQMSPPPYCTSCRRHSVPDGRVYYR